MAASLVSTVRERIRESRDERAARVSLQRELSSYHSTADLNDLHAILDRYSDHETKQIRRVLASQNSL